MAQQGPIFRYSRFGFSLEVWPNRVEVSEGTLITKRQTILMRNISDVSVQGLTRKLHIVTNDGRKQEFNLGAQAENARAAIISTL